MFEKLIWFYHITHHSSCSVVHLKNSAKNILLTFLSIQTISKSTINHSFKKNARRRYYQIYTFPCIWTDSVLCLGFSTSKGELVRSIMFPKPVDFKFQRHSYYFVMVLAGIAAMGFVYTIVLMVRDAAFIFISLFLLTNYQFYLYYCFYH